MATLISSFNSGDISGKIYRDNFVYTIKGNVSNARGSSLEYLASAPADLRMSHAGSGLPFASHTEAYDHTPNSGTIELGAGGAFEFSVIEPNSYYVNEGVKLIPPHVHIFVKNGDTVSQYSLKLNSSIPHRSLTNLPNEYSRATGR